jgi:hypothetical protein
MLRRSNGASKEAVRCGRLWKTSAGTIDACALAQAAGASGSANDYTEAPLQQRGFRSVATANPKSALASRRL